MDAVNGMSPNPESSELFVTILKRVEDGTARIEAKLDKVCGTVIRHDEKIATLEEHDEEHGKELDNLKGTVNRWKGIVAFIGFLIATALAVLGLTIK